MSSEQFPPNDSAAAHPKLNNQIPHEDLDAAQHTPLYPSLGRIGYVPDPELYEARVRASTKRLQEQGSLNTLPKGWPTVVEGPMVWTGTKLQRSSEWVYSLSNRDIAEIRSGLLDCKALKQDLSGVNKATFPLPHLGDRLRGLSTEVHTGRGFFILRGLNPAEFTREENVILYLGISSYVAEQRGRQNHEGSLISHITDAVLSDTPRSDRPSLYSNVAQPYHNDITPDILALYCLNSAIYGGKSCIASSWAVYNELAATRPDIVRTLSENSWDTTSGYTFLKHHALLYYHEGKPILNFSRRTLTSNDKFPRSRQASTFEPLTEAQAEAIDAVHFTAAKHGLEIDLQPGDMLFLNNLGMMHGRNSFEDSSESKRYFLRLWLRNPEQAWGIPDGLRRVHSLVFEPQPGVEDHWDIDPYSVPGHQLNPSTNCG